MDISSTVVTLDGTQVDMKGLDDAYDVWVHTDRKIAITHCSPDSLMAGRMKMTDQVYPIRRYVRGRVLLLSNASYQALRLLKDIFTQMNYIIKIETGKSDADIQNIIEVEAKNEDNKYVDSFVVIIYGTPAHFKFDYIPKTLNNANAPILRGKPKLIYVIGDDSIVKQIYDARLISNDPDFLSASIGFNGVMFYMYILCKFAHELSAHNIWSLMLQNAQFHRYTASTHCTLTKEFYFFPGLTSSVLPDEIEEMDPDDMYLYKKMLDHGQVKTYNIRLMFVGLYGAGKTSTARRIMGKDINDVTSTDGIDVHTGRCRIDIRNRTWQTVDNPRESMPNKQLRKLHLADEVSQSYVPDIKKLEDNCSEMDEHILADEYDQSNYIMGTDDKVVAKSESMTNKRSFCEIDDTISSLTSETKSVSMEIEPGNVRSPTSSITSTLSDYVMVDDAECSVTNEKLQSTQRARRVFETKSGHEQEIQYQEAAVSLWDFAGQFVYYATHQLFFSPRSIYLLVLNMEEDLEKTLKDWYMDIRGKESIEAKGGINFWLRSIFTYANGSSSGIPPIILVGTHSDALSGSQEEKWEKAKSYFSEIRSIFQGSPHINNIQNEYFLLDNTKQDAEINRLRDTILSISQTMPYWGETTPAKWLELEQALDDIRLGGKSLVTMSQLRKIDNSLASPLQDENHLRLFLRAHHETGSFIYFGDSETLQHVVILEPQWIINAFRSLIAATDFGPKYGTLQRKWDEFNETGQLTTDFARQIWAKDTECTFLENSDLLLDFLEKLNIISRASVYLESSGDINTLDFYYVPCMLRQSPPEYVLQQPIQQDKFSTPILCLSFHDNFMPPAIFYRVVALCIGKWPIATNGKRILMYCGCAVFVVNFGKGEDLHRLYIFSRKSKIGIRITRYSSRKSGMVDPAICDRVRRFITSAVKKEFTRFHISQTDTEENHFKCQIQCKETEEEDVLDEGLHNVDTLLAAIGTDLFCVEHSDRIDPHPLRPVGMLHEWFNEKIPQNFRLENLSVLDTWVERLPDEMKNASVTEKTMSRLTNAIGNDWPCLMKEIGVGTVQIDQIEENYSDNTRLKKFHGLYQWKSGCEKRDVRPSNRLLLEGLRRAGRKGLEINLEETQNVFDDILDYRQKGDMGIDLEENKM